MQEREKTPHPQYIELLVRLGLTLTQAKIFIALATIGTATAKLASQNAGLPREVIYQIMPTLQNKGLIKTQLTTPQTYTAIPPEQAFQLLLKQQTQQQKQTKQEISQTLRTLKKLQKPQSNHPYSQTTIIPQGKPAQTQITREIKNAQKSIDIITTYPKLLKMNKHHTKNLLNQTKQKNIQIQVLIEKQTQTGKEPPQTPLSFGEKDNNYLHIRYSPNANLTNMIIFDNSRVFLNMNPNQKQFETTSMYTNNPNLAPLATTYFQTNWQKAIPLQPLKTALQKENII